MINIAGSADISPKDPPTRDQIIRKNLKTREEKFRKSPNQEGVERWKQISKHLTGGRW